MDRHPDAPDRDGLLFVVRRTEELVGRGGGVVLTPGIPASEQLDRGEALRLRRPDGSALVVVTGGRSFPARREPHAGRRDYPVQVTSKVVAEDVPKGTQVWRMDGAG
jgi:hypothetical protein